MKNKILSLAAIFAFAGLAYAGSAFLATKALADNENNNPMSDLVQKLTDKFGLNREEVQSVFDEHHQEMMANMQAKEEERLNQLVTDKKITEQQKQLILQKKEELRTQHQNEMQNLKDKTVEERKAIMEQHRQELENWANQNGIDVQYLMGFKGFGHRGMRFEK